MKITSLRKSVCTAIIAAMCTLPVANQPVLAQQQQAELADVQQIVAIVNDELISLYDLKQRALLFVISSGARQISPEEQRYLQQQALQSLVDDRLKLQEAAKYDAVISKQEQEAAYANYAKQFNLSPDDFEKNLNQAGVAKSSLLKQIEASIAWDQLVGGLLRPQVNISDEEINSVIERLESSKGQDEFYVREIFLLVSEQDQKEENRQTALRIIEQLNNEAPFQVLARQFSQSTSSATGGDLGWVMKSELAPEVLSAVQALNKGEIAGPVETQDGFYVLQMVDRRQVMTASKSDATVELKHMFFEISDKARPEEVEALENAIKLSSRKMSSCEEVDTMSDEMGAKDAGDLGTMKIGDLPVHLHDPLYELEPGQASDPVKEDKGFRVFVMCDKKMPEVRMPDFDTVENSLSRDRVSKIARRHLRDLRRDAIIDYR